MYIVYAHIYIYIYIYIYIHIDVYSLICLTRCDFKTSLNIGDPSITSAAQTYVANSHCAPSGTSKRGDWAEILRSWDFEIFVVAWAAMQSCFLKNKDNITRNVIHCNVVHCKGYMDEHAYPCRHSFVFLSSAYVPLYKDACLHASVVYTGVV